jgi:hypothetical protein
MVFTSENVPGTTPDYGKKLQGGWGVCGDKNVKWEEQT